MEHKFEILCLDRKTGKILWQQTAITAVPHEGYHPTYGSFASNSPVTDGKYVYAFFGSRGMYCYDMKGKLIWKKDYGVQMRMRMAFGEGMAPVISGDRLILVFDHEGDSFMVMLDKNTGKEIWKVNRDEKSNWAAPLVVDYKGQKQIVVSATNKVRSYDFNTGKVIWECAGLGSQHHSSACSPGRPDFRDERLYEAQPHGDPARTGRRSDRHRRRCLEPDQRAIPTRRPRSFTTTSFMF